MDYPNIRLRTIPDKHMILLVENIRGEISSVLGNHYVKSDDNK